MLVALAFIEPILYERDVNVLPDLSAWQIVVSLVVTRQRFNLRDDEA